MNVPAFRFYLFDIDGTLLDSAADIGAAVLGAFEKRGRADAVTQEFIRANIGLHLRATFADVFPEYTEEQMLELIKDYREIYLGRNHQGTSVYPGVADGLAALGGKKGTATTKGSETTGKVLELFGLRRYIDHVQGTDGFPHKPAPDVILRSMAALDATPAETLMVGDSLVDMEAGRAAGIKTCAVRYGYGADRIPEELPDFWVDSLLDLSA